VPLFPHLCVHSFSSALLNLDVSSGPRLGRACIWLKLVKLLMLGLVVGTGWTKFSLTRFVSEEGFLTSNSKGYEVIHCCEVMFALNSSIIVTIATAKVVTLSSWKCSGRHLFLALVVRASIASIII